MGIDHDEFKDDAVPSTAGQADALYLMTYNISDGKIKVLALNRDIMTDISRYDGDGNYYDTATKQLCLAYAFGDGKHLSAQNQVVAVERLIYNIPISTYYAIDFSSLKILNDDIGGVTLTPEYTFSSFTEGQTVRLMGETAEQFVRYRNTDLLDDNLRRMSCQKLYLNSFASQILPSIKKDILVPLKLYQDSSKYTVTNLDINIMTYLASTLAVNYSGLNIMSVEGKYIETKNDNYAEYKIDKTDLFEKILNIYYKKIN
jgi:anionic cell wall polymer biosynthesis LytR-Cps2A-Psr (LCP) family protein